MMNKTMMTLLGTSLIAGSAFANNAPVATPSATATVIAKHGADDKQRDDRGGRRYGDDDRGEQVAREGGVRGRGRGI